MKTLLILALLLISEAAISQIWSITGLYNENIEDYIYIPGIFMIDNKIITLSLGEEKATQLYIRSDEERYIKDIKEVGRFIVADNMEHGTKTHIIITKRAIGMTIEDVQFIFRVD